MFVGFTLKRKKWKRLAFFFSRGPTVGDNLIFIGTPYVVEKSPSENNDVCELSTASRTRGILYVFDHKHASIPVASKLKTMHGTNGSSWQSMQIELSVKH